MFPTRSNFNTCFGLVLLLLGTGSCTVYAPIQPTMPLITAVGQAEAAANIQPNGRVEASVAYSPISHLLLTAGGTVCPKLGTNNFLVTRQYELGVGGYLPLGSSWLVNGLGGYGQAVNTRRYEELFGGNNEYHARYNKLFAQVGVAHMRSSKSIGLTYRLTQVYFSTIIDPQLGDLPLPQMLRHEALFFVRNTWSEHWDSQVAMGMSVSSTQKRDDEPSSSSNGSSAYEANRNLFPAVYVSLGVIYKLH